MTRSVSRPMLSAQTWQKPQEMTSAVRSLTAHLLGLLDDYRKKLVILPFPASTPSPWVYFGVVQDGRPAWRRILLQAAPIEGI